MVTDEIAEEITEESPAKRERSHARRVGRRFVRTHSCRGGADEVAKAEEVLAEPEAEADSLGEQPPKEGESATETSEGEPAQDDVSATIDVFEQRAEALVPIEASLTRKLRRVLADEQNEVLDRLRRVKPRAS